GAELLAVLNAQIGCARAMLDALEREHAALLDARHAGLDEARADKDRLVATLAALARRRVALSTLEPAPDGPEWSTLLELIAACRDHNRRNGTLLGARRQAVATVLRSLQGTASGPYGPDGRPTGSSGGRPLGAA